MISFKDFSKVEMKAAKIKKVEDIEGKDRLYLLHINVGGDDNRTMLSGIKEFYSKEELTGKTVAVVSNLEPMKIGENESQAMVLAAKNSKNEYKVVFLDESIEPGTKLE